MSRDNPHRADDVAERRQEAGSGAESRKHVPHVTENAEEEPIQRDMPSPDPVPVLPANASGTDRVDTDEQAEPIDEESMYDRRPARDKDRAPSGRKT